MIKDNKINKFTLAFPSIIEKYLKNIMFKDELLMASTKIGRNLDKIKKTHLYSEIVEEPFTYHYFIEYASEIIASERLLFLELWQKMVANVQHERKDHGIGPLNSEKISDLFVEELLNHPQYSST